MTLEGYQALKPFEKQLASAVNSNFARFRTPEIEAFSEAVKIVRGTGLTRQERTCPSCFLRAVKAVAADFEKYKASPRGKAAIKELENERTEENEGASSRDEEIQG